MLRMNHTTILHVVDQDLVRRATFTRLGMASGYHVEIYENLREFVRRRPMQGFVFLHAADAPTVRKLLHELGKSEEWLPVIGYCENAPTRTVVDALAAGALDYMDWPIDITELHAGVERAARRAAELHDRRHRAAVAKFRIGLLTHREREVLEHLTDGRSNKAIAAEMHISPRTVEIYRTKMMAKLGANHAAQVVRLHLEADWGEEQAA